VAAGPTTSIREGPYQADIIKRFGVRAVIGKGGMGPKMQKACQENGCVYLHAIGGAAQIYARCVQRVLSVRLEEFGSPEAVWELQVKNFPAVVTIDSHGNNLQQVVTDHSRVLLAATIYACLIRPAARIHDLRIKFQPLIGLQEDRGRN